MVAKTNHSRGDPPTLFGLLAKTRRNETGANCKSTELLKAAGPEALFTASRRLVFGVSNFCKIKLLKMFYLQRAGMQRQLLLWRYRQLEHQLKVIEKFGSQFPLQRELWCHAFRLSVS